MKLKWMLNNTQVIVSTLGVAALAAGCCSKGTGGSYSSTSTAPPYMEATSTTTQQTTSTAQPSGEATGSQTIPLYKEQVNVGAQQVQDGTVTIKKIVKTETVNQPVTLKKETLVIDRQPSSSQEPGAQAFQEQQISIQLHHEEPFVSTQVVPNGQVVATTKADSQQTTIQKQVRTEDVAIDKGNAQNVIIQGDLNSQQSQPMGGGGDTGGQSSGGSQNQNK
jgi:uncharacterized protein (TIGR02271 family)